MTVLLGANNPQVTVGTKTYTLYHERNKPTFVDVVTSSTDKSIYTLFLDDMRSFIYSTTNISRLLIPLKIKR